MNFEYTLKTEILGKSFEIKELSFADYKNFCKTIFNQTDLVELNGAFLKLLDSCLVGSPTTTILEKVLLLLTIRGLTLGKLIQITYNDVPVTIDNSMIIECFDKRYKFLQYQHNNLNLVFDFPQNFILSDKDVFKTVCESITRIETEDKVYDLSKYNATDREAAVLALPSVPVYEIFSYIIDHYKNYNFKVDQLDNFNLNIFDKTFLLFFKFIFDENFKSVLELEYNLRRHLNFSSQDLQHVSYPECKIMLNKFADENKQKDQGPRIGNTPITQ